MTVSPLERRALLALVSLIRDSEPNPDEWTSTDIPLRALHERCYILDPDRSYELQRRNQRQSMRRALGRLHKQGLLFVMALAWVNIDDQAVIRWQGGGSRKTGETYPVHGGGFYTASEDTPRWRLVALTREGVALALALERDAAA